MDTEFFAYRKLIAYQKGRELVKFIYHLTKQFPPEERFALSNQIQRAAVSVTSNIAEAMGRYSDKDKLHFIEFSYGSLLEVMSQMEVAFDLEYISINDFTEVEQRITDICRMLSGLRKTYGGRLQTPVSGND